MTQPAATKIFHYSDRQLKIIFLWHSPSHRGSWRSTQWVGSSWLAEIFLIFFFTQRDASIVFIAFDTWVRTAIANFPQTILIIYSEEDSLLSMNTLMKHIRSWGLRGPLRGLCMPLAHCSIPFLFLPFLHQSSKLTPQGLEISEDFTGEAKNEVILPIILQKLHEALFHLLS